jgi:tetratricopeptide (TPR) repeat protein
MAAEAHAALGRVRLFADWDPAQARLHAETALELDPSSVEGLTQCGHVDRVTGRFEEAVAHFRRACELEPLQSILRLQLGRSLMDARRLDEASRELRAGIELSPERPQGHTDLIETYLAGSREPEAVETAARWLEFLRHPELAAAIRDGYREGGLRAAMDPVLRWQIRGHEQFGIANAFPLATLFAQVGEVDEALQWLEHSLRQHEASFLDVNVRPGLDPLRSDPRFIAMVERSGLASG